MKISNNFNLATSISIFLVSLCHARDPEPLRLPEPLSGVVSKAIEIKTEAMKLPAMRSEEGKLGKKVENLMDQIANLADEEITKQAQQTQDHDIQAKIILWAKDREKRPAEYERFAKLYLNRPANEDAVVYFYRPWQNVGHPLSDTPPTPESFVPRPGTWTPHPIDEDDVIEANRYVMEYCFFMPPTGDSFNNEHSRYHLMNSLLSLKMVSKSYEVFKVDSDICFEVTKDIEIPTSPTCSESSNRDGWFAMILNPSRLSYERLSKYCTRPYGKHWIEKSFTYFWGTPKYDNGRAFNNHQEWIKLAKQEWTEIHQQNFAKFLLSRPTPEQLDPNPPEFEIPE